MTPAHIIHSAGVERAERASRLWRESAACRDHDINLWFPVSEQGKAAPDVATPKAICAGCPVRAACLDYALTAGEPEGIWGGLMAEERRAIRRAQRSCARPGCQQRFVPTVHNQRYCGPDCIRAARSATKQRLRQRQRQRQRAS